MYISDIGNNSYRGTVNSAEPTCKLVLSFRRAPASEWTITGDSNRKYMEDSGLFASISTCIVPCIRRVPLAPFALLMFAIRICESLGSQR